MWRLRKHKPHRLGEESQSMTGCALTHRWTKLHITQMHEKTQLWPLWANSMHIKLLSLQSNPSMLLYSAVMSLDITGCFCCSILTKVLLCIMKEMNACWLGQSNGWKIIPIFEIVSLLMLPAGPELWDLCFNCSQRKRCVVMEWQVCQTYLNTKHYKILHELFLFSLLEILN